MKKVQIDPATQRRPTSRKQNRSAKIKEQLTQQVEVQVIPAKADMEGYERPKPRVCAYCRVSTDMDTQALSYELQVQNYTEYITSNPDWEFAGIYADKGISGTSLRHRDDFNRMIADCEAGKIDLIVTKAVTRFARNVVDTISTVRKLKQLSPPVGVFFETERINTLDTTSETYLGLISLFAQGESESKSESLKWSYIRRWKRGTGIYPTWSLLGYEVDEEGHWVIVENEAELIRVIYDMYLNGHSSPQIAEILTRSGIPTATNKPKWSSGAVLGILRNEKYCGDVLCQKTMTLDVFTHKSVKNKGDKKQYFIEGHHEAIIDNFHVIHHQGRGNHTGVVIEYGKNLTDMEHDDDNTDVYTDLLPYAVSTAEDGTETVITLAEVLIPVVETTLVQRKTYIKDFSEYFDMEETITEEALRAKANNYVDANPLGIGKPSVTVAFEPLWKQPEYAAVLERVSLCDTVTVRHSVLGITAKAKVITTRYDTLAEKYISIELGSAKANLLQNVSSAQDAAEQAAAKVDRFPALMNSAIAGATDLITGQTGGYVVINTDGSGKPYIS